MADSSCVKGYGNNTTTPDGILVYAPGTETQAFGVPIIKRACVLLGCTWRRREAARARDGPIKFVAFPDQKRGKKVLNRPESSLSTGVKFRW
ncbi:hypothetical protein M407DRAFT_18477 [Tulasnella calospora MUT 4182]|uniref:Uncharacterized protein n=1 Tax=Tulasnella calospora MUT 4182 TaxID=1051891 RepID=A0A0C3LFJ0_9AGAM|nr:hypothetical protein M407DRAFT_18477 [Tulasnella calospora MUT 4182]